MKQLPLPAVTAAAASLLALPFSLPAAGTLFLTACLGGVIHADYVLRRQRIRLPRLSRPTPVRPACGCEQHQLAA